MTASRSRSMPCGKGTETGQIVLPDGDEPVRKTFALALGQHDGEGADVSGERVGLGAVGAHGFEQQLFGLGKGFRSPVVDLRGVQHLSLREIAREAGISHGQLQHYFASRQALLTFAVDFAAEQTTQRISRSLEQLGDPPHPRDVLRLTLTEMLPLHADARATSRMNAAYVLEALHDEEALARTRDAMAQGRAQMEGLIRRAIADGHIDSTRDPATETDLQGRTGALRGARRIRGGQAGQASWTRSGRAGHALTGTGRAASCQAQTGQSVAPRVDAGYSVGSRHSTHSAYGGPKPPR